MSGSLLRLAVPAGLLEVVGTLEAGEILRQRRRGTGRSLVSSDADLDPTSVRLLALSWWPAGLAALASAARLPRFGVSQRWTRPCLLAGVAVTGAGVALRQWAIATLGDYFVGHVVVQPGQTVVSSGPYRWLRHPSYTGQWLEMIGVGLSTGNAVSTATCVIVPLVGITVRIHGEERDLAARLPGYRNYMQGKPRLIPFLW
jgi:protein-S-isoprenylcysteine O-methyltransferase